MGNSFDGNAKGFNDPVGALVLADCYDEVGLHSVANEIRTGQTRLAEMPKRGDDGYGDSYGYGDDDGDGD